MSEAATRGLLRSIKPWDSIGLVSEQMILNELSRQRAASWQTAAVQVRIMAASDQVAQLQLIKASPTSGSQLAKTFRNGLLNTLSDLQATLFPWQKRTETVDDEVEKKAEEVWRDRFGDENDPETQKRIAEAHRRTGEALKKKL